MTHVINKPAEVNRFYFTSGKNFKSFPKEITVDHTRYTFRDGLQLLVNTGQGVIRFFDMTDGITNYRLRQHQGTWTLISLEN